MIRILVLATCALLVTSCARISVYSYNGQEYAIFDEDDLFGPTVLRRLPDGTWMGIDNEGHDRLTSEGALVRTINASEIVYAKRRPRPRLSPGEGVRLPRTSLPPGEGVRKRNPITEAIVEGRGGE